MIYLTRTCGAHIVYVSSLPYTVVVIPAAPPAAAAVLSWCVMQFHAFYLAVKYGARFDVAAAAAAAAIVFLVCYFGEFTIEEAANFGSQHLLRGL